MRYVSILLSLMILISLTACSSDPNSSFQKNMNRIEKGIKSDIARWTGASPSPSPDPITDTIPTDRLVNGKTQAMDLTVLSDDEKTVFQLTQQLVPLMADPLRKVGDQDGASYFEQTKEVQDWYQLFRKETVVNEPANKVTSMTIMDLFSHTDAGLKYVFISFIIHYEKPWASNQYFMLRWNPINQTWQITDVIPYTKQEWNNLKKKGVENKK